MAQARNTNAGRHFAGTPIAKNLGSWVTVRHDLGPTGNFVGTGRNRKTAQRPEYKPVKPASSQNYTRQAEQFTRSAPEPFRNSTRSANPRGVESQALNARYASPSPSVTPGDWRRAQPQRDPHSQEEINRATGHAADYEPAGQSQVVGVQRKQPRAGDINLPGGPRANPQSWKANPASRMKSNMDIFGPGMEAYRRQDGGRGSVL